MPRFRPSRALTSAALLLICAGTPLHAQFSSEEIVRRAVVQVDELDVQGAFLYEEKRNRRDFSIVLENLPAGAYTVTVGGVFQGFMSSVRTVTGTFAEVNYSTRQRGDTLFLGFEPRGQLIEIRSVLDGDRLYASGMLPLSVPTSELEPPEFNKVRVREDFNVLDGSGARGRISIRSSKRRVTMRVNVRGLVPGIYNLLGDGLPLGTIIAEGRGRGTIMFSTDPRGTQQDLTFDPTGIMYELVRVDLPDPDGPFGPGDGDLMVMQTMVGNAQDPGGDLPPIGTSELTILDSSGFDSDATGTLQTVNNVPGEQAALIVRVDGLPEDTYTVELISPIVGSRVLGFIVVGDGDNGMTPTTRGTPDDPMMDDPMDGDGEGGDDQDDSSMLPQGVGPDEPRPTSGRAAFTGTSTFYVAASGDDADEISYELDDESFSGSEFNLTPWLYSSTVYDSIFYADELFYTGFVFNRSFAIGQDDFQGVDIRIVDSEGRTYLLGRIPDSGLLFPQFDPSLEDQSLISVDEFDALLIDFLADMEPDDDDGGGDDGGDRPGGGDDDGGVPPDLPGGGGDDDDDDDDGGGVPPDLTPDDGDDDDDGGGGIFRPAR